MFGSLHSPTPYPDLNALLDELVAGVRQFLGDNFCGAYLHGSFAVGGADEHSDVDFMVVTNGEVTDEQLAGLQRLHKRLYELESPWSQHLEGSYIPKDALRRVDPARAPFWYLDNGASELVRDNHCNQAVVRWGLRERGIPLAGPDPKTLIDPVTPQQLSEEALARIDEYAQWAPEGQMSRWKQPYLVLTFCRLLQTVSEGIVTSKRQAAGWALGALDPKWTALIRRAVADRPDPWVRVGQPADPAIVGETLAFVDYAVERVKA